MLLTAYAFAKVECAISFAGAQEVHDAAIANRREIEVEKAGGVGAALPEAA